VRRPDVRRSTAILFILGVAAAAAAVVHAGAGAVLRSLGSLRISGLLLIALLHLPVVVLMGLAWRMVSGDPPPATRTRFIWARLVRDAAAEVLPFSQLGGFLFGLRALGRGRQTVARGAVSMSFDLVIELAAKLPYVIAGLLVLHTLAPHASIARPLSLALGITAAVVAIVALAAGRVGASLEYMARALGRRWSAIPSLDDPSIRRQVQASFARILAQRRRLSCSFALHLACWTLGAAEAWVVFALLGVHLTWAKALAIDSTVVGLRTFAFMIPAAAGVQETSYLLGAGVFGIPPAVAMAASFARRARDLTLGVAALGVAAGADPNFSVLPAIRAALQPRVRREDGDDGQKG
jgi:glycosyltransferase 2 family protein